ncbi:hypothetical protein ACFLWF_02225 [Chloroflexota bacterium]
MPTIEILLFFILVILLFFAVVDLYLFALKPLQTSWAVRQAGKFIATGKLPYKWYFNNVYRILTTTQHDLEAAYL